MAKTKSNKPHYVNNKEFLAALVEWNKTFDLDKGDQVPPVTNYIAECFLKISTHLSYRPNFINYTYRDEMISDGIENCLQYVKNFDPIKSQNPFAYFTQIIYYAFLRRIQKEKKQVYIKHKAYEKSVVFNEMVVGGDGHHQETTDTSFAQEYRGEFITSYEKSLKERREKTKRAKQDKENDNTSS